MSLPDARVVHSAPKRLRIRIPSRKGDNRYFGQLRDEFLKRGKFERVEVNPATGSILLTGRSPDLADVRDYARNNGLFDVLEKKHTPVPLTKTMVEPLAVLNSALKRITGGRINLPGFAFILLLGSGLFEIVKGNFRSPPWYTALWYAFGVFTKSLADMADEAGEVE